jgi:hypothetical protein
VPQPASERFFCPTNGSVSKQAENFFDGKTPGFLSKEPSPLRPAGRTSEALWFQRSHAGYFAVRTERRVRSRLDKYKKLLAEVASIPGNSRPVTSNQWRMGASVLCTVHSTDQAQFCVNRWLESFSGQQRS